MLNMLGESQAASSSRKSSSASSNFFTVPQLEAPCKPTVKEKQNCGLSESPGCKGKWFLCYQLCCWHFTNQNSLLIHPLSYLVFLFLLFFLTEVGDTLLAVLASNRGLS